MWTILLLLATGTLARKTGGGGSYGRSGSSHSYPHSTGYSGTGTGGSHTYPHSTGYSGSNAVPKQTVHHNVNSFHKTEVHHHYHNHNYSPPPHIGYGSASYPVYREPPPVYVYQYRDSGSRFDNLLTGLALYNLGRMSAGHGHYYDSNREYRGTPGEVCKLGVRKHNGDYEETRVDCRLMTSFIWDSPSQSHVSDQQEKIVSTTVVNTTQVHDNNGSVTTVTVSNTTIDALQNKGKSIDVTPGMNCYIIRSSMSSTMRKEVPCGLLQTYAQNSWRPNSSERLTPILVVLVLQIFLIKVI